MSEDITPLAEPAGPSHYYGDTVRVLFVIAALLILAAQIIGKAFLTPGAALVTAIVLIMTAGFTNPAQRWIHFLNVALSAGGLIICASIVLERFQGTQELMTSSVIAVLLVVIFALALYASTRTLRGSLLRNTPEVQ